MVDLTENHPPHFTVTVNTDAYLVVAKQSVVLVSTDFASAVADFLAVIYATEAKTRKIAITARDNHICIAKTPDG